MDKGLTRVTIILVAIYFIVSYIFASFGVDILTNTYALLFEACVVSYTFCSGNFHCRYMRWTAASILLVEILNHTDYYFNYIPVSVFNILPIFILALGLGTSITLAIRHFYKVIQLNKKIDAHNRRNTRTH